MTKNRTLGRCSAGKQSSGEKWKITTIIVYFARRLYCTAELEGDRLIYEPGGVTRQCVDRGDNAEIGRLGRSI